MGLPLVCVQLYALMYLFLPFNCVAYIQFPTNTTTCLGTATEFDCASTDAQTIFYYVNNTPAVSLSAQGITVSAPISNGNVTLVKLNIPGTSASVSQILCKILFTSGLFLNNTSYLTIQGPPLAVTNLTAIPFNATFIRLIWNSPPVAQSLPALTYVVEVKNGSGALLYNDTVTIPQLDIAILDPCDQYQATITTMCGSTASVNSITLKFFGATPSAPNNLTITTLNNTSAELTWVPPYGFQKSSLLLYIVQFTNFNGTLVLNETVGMPQAFVNISSCNIHQAAVAAICKTGTDVIFATYTFEQSCNLSTVIPTSKVMFRGNGLIAGITIGGIAFILIMSIFVSIIILKWNRGQRKKYPLQQIDINADIQCTQRNTAANDTNETDGKPSEIEEPLDSGPKNCVNTLLDEQKNEMHISAYKNFLMGNYSANLPMGQKWPEMGLNEYINLTVHEKPKLEETEELETFTALKNIEITQLDMHGSGSPYSVIIITGAPGVGKSCFMWNLATKWKERTLFKEYELVIVIRLRDHYVRQAKEVVDLIQYEIQEIRNTVHKWIIMKNGKGCLLIFDGFDEFPAELRRESVIKDIVSGEKLGKASLIITTRSNAAKDLYSICNRRKCQYLEVLGFNDKQVNDYIVSSSLLNDFEAYLQCYPNIRSFMCIPLHCAIVVQIYKSQQSMKEVPKTMTELYTDAIKVLIIRSIQLDDPSFVKEGLKKFADLPQDYQKCLIELARIAHESTLNDELLFCTEISKQIKRLDLLEEQPEVYNPASALVSYNFVHQTIQEFLAAYHISLLPSNEQLEFLCEQFHISRMAMVIRFVAGLTKFNQLTDTDDLKHLFITADTQILMQCVHCLFETQDPIFIRTVLQYRNIFDLTLFTLSPHDCYALNYCIAMTKAQIDLRLESCDISDEALTMLVPPTAQDSIFCYVKELVLTKNPAINSKLIAICAALMNNSCVTTLWIEKCNIDSDGVKEIKKLLLKTTTLNCLCLNSNRICDKGASHLGDGLKGNKSLKYLFVRNCSIGDTGLQAISEALLHNKTLVELNLDGNPIGNNGILLLCNQLKRSAFYLKKLLLQQCDINPNDENCIEHLRALCEKEDFTLCIDYPVQKILQSPSVNHDLTKTAVEPDKRNAGCGIIFEDKLFVWGGEMDIKGKVGGCRYLPATESNAFDVWNSETHMWSHQPTWGDVPDLGLGSSLTSYSRWLYLYGGLKEYEENIFAGEIYRISMKTFKWEKIQVPVTAIKPSPRYTMGVILYDHKLCMFGGVGPEIVKDQDPGAKWVEAVNRDKGSFGWNNEYYEFDLTNVYWSAPLGKDSYRPKPIGSFSFCKFAYHKAILFGGNGCEDDGHSHSNRLYQFDLKNRVWTGPITLCQPWPTGCRFHSLTPLFDPEIGAAESKSPHWMVLLWGKVSENAISQDAWVLNVATWAWKKLQLHQGLKPRAWHIACSHYTQRKICVFGGNMLVDNDYYKRRDAVTDLQLIPFEHILQQVEDHSV